MKIAVIGSGNIGGTLGRKWAEYGHAVVFGVRDPHAEKVASLLAHIGPEATADFIPNAIGGVDAVVFAIPGRVMDETLVQLAGNLNGKILIDTTNSVGQTPMHKLDVLRQAAPDSPLFRAFSNLGWENFANPVIEGEQVDLFYCGDKGKGQTAVDELIAAIGLRPIYIGGLDQVDVIDSLTRLWFILALQQGRGRHLALKMLV